MKGRLSSELMDAVLDAIPVDFSVLDANDNVAGWNRHETRIFKRPESVVGLNVRKCHPQKSLAKVEQILTEMKQGKRDKARFWIDMHTGPDKAKRKILIEYYALRGKDGRYLGCLEASQDITEHQALKGEKRLLD